MRSGPSGDPGRTIPSPSLGLVGTTQPVKPTEPAPGTAPHPAWHLVARLEVAQCCLTPQSTGAHPLPSGLRGGGGEMWARGAGTPGACTAWRDLCALVTAAASTPQARPGAQSGGTVQARRPAALLWILAPRRISPRSACLPTHRPGLSPARAKGDTLPAKVYGHVRAPSRKEVGVSGGSQARPPASSP